MTWNSESVFGVCGFPQQDEALKEPACSQPRYEHSNIQDEIIQIQMQPQPQYTAHISPAASGTGAGTSGRAVLLSS